MCPRGLNTNHEGASDPISAKIASQETMIEGQRSEIMPWIKSNQPVIVERTVAGICYLTVGLAGLLYIIVTGNKTQSLFFRFHFLQSIMLGIFLFLFQMAYGALSQILGGILGLIPGLHGGAVLMEPIAVLMQGVNILILVLCAYGAIFAFLGKQAEIPGVSRLVRQQMR
jgi:uncharacterized membrane protein